MKVLDELAARIAGAMTKPTGPGGITQRIEERDGHPYVIIEGPSLIPGQPGHLCILPVKGHDYSQPDNGPGDLILMQDEDQP